MSTFTHKLLTSCLALALTSVVEAPTAAQTSVEEAPAEEAPAEAVPGSEAPAPEAVDEASPEQTPAAEPDAGAAPVEGAEPSSQAAEAAAEGGMEPASVEATSEASEPSEAVPAPAVVEPSEAAPSEAAPSEAEADGEPEPPPDFTGGFHGEYRFRLMAMSDLPLTPFESKGFAPELGQNLWGSQWLRVGFDVSYRHRLSFVAEASALDGVVFGDETNGVMEADRPRDGVTTTRADAFDLRKAYVQYVGSFGALRAGLQPSHWGLGLLANAGDEAPSFGDYVEGDRDLRLLFASRPFGLDVPFEAIVAGDLVYDDLIARLRDGDRAYQGILALRYHSEEEGVKRELGFYGVYRRQRSPVPGGSLPTHVPDDRLDVWALDLYANWDFAEPSGGRLFAAFEGVAIFGETTITRSIDRAKEDVRQYLGAIQLGRRGESLDITLEGGFTSGDSNTEDGVQRRATMNRSHRVGLLLFPQVMAWNTARAASLAASDELGGRPSPGSQLLPTNGGVAGAYYLNPHVSYRAAPWIDLRAGLVWGRASSAVVDPYRQRAESRTANYQGGDARQRDLGLELDAAVLLSYDLPEGVVLTGGVEGGWFRPGRAFDDASGRAMSSLGLLRLRVGLSF